MKLRSPKILTFLLLITLMTTSMGSALGYVWCDSGCLSDTHIANHIDDHTDGHTDKNIDQHTDVHTVVCIGNQTVTLDQHMGGEDDTCTDSSIKSSDGVVEEIEAINCTPNVEMTSTYDRLNNVKIIRYAFNNSIQESPPRVTQALLTHRTVVLLN